MNPIGKSQPVKWKRVFALAATLLFLSIGSTFAQSFNIDWFTIDGGGGTSTGGVFSVTGTIGQPDAGHMSGGSYSVDGGFWGIIGAVQIPGSPTLTVFATVTNTVIVSWPASSGSFSLQQNSNLSTVNWSGVTNVVNTVGTNNQVKIAPPIGSRFYRLVYP